MSQALLQIAANPSGLDMRVQINQIVLALITNHSGPSAPATTYPGMWWGDTTADRLRRRNAANSAWIDIGPLDDVLGDLRTLIAANAAAASTAQTSANSAASAASAAQTTANSKMANTSAAIVSALGYTPVNPGAIPTFGGGVGGADGGEIHLARAPSGGLADDTNIDMAGATLRFWEGGGALRGASLDLTRCAAGVGSQIALTSDIVQWGSSPTNVTAARSLGGQYVNATSKWRIVRISLNNPGTTGQYAAGYVNNAEEARLWLYTSGTPGTLTLLVPPGMPYQCNITANITMTNWIEYL